MSVRWNSEPVAMAHIRGDVITIDGREYNVLRSVAGVTEIQEREIPASWNAEIEARIRTGYRPFSSMPMPWIAGRDA